MPAPEIHPRFLHPAGIPNGDHSSAATFGRHRLASGPWHPCAERTRSTFATDHRSWPKHYPRLNKIPSQHVRDKMKFSCQKLLGMFLLAALAFSPAANAGLRLHGSVSASTGLTSFATLPVVGGGFTSGIQVSTDGLTTVARVDVYGTYLYDIPSSTWQLLDTTSRMPAGANPGGGIEIVVAPSNSQIIYKWMGDGNLYRSLDRGSSFVQLTQFGTHDAGANNGGDVTGFFNFPARLDGYKMAVDPINPDVLYIGRSDGVFVSVNASQGTGSTPSFASVTGITAATFGQSGYNFAFDASSGQTSSKTNVLYVSSEGQGIFKMSTPGGSFSAVASTPSMHVNNMTVSNNGVLWIADNNNQNAHKLVAGTWTTYGAASTGIRPKAVVVDPNHSASSTTEHVILIEDSGAFSTSTTSGISGWTGRLPFTRSSTLVPWLASTNEGYMSTSLIAYNKVTDVVWLAEGIGVWTAPGATNSSYVWTAQTAAIESLEPQNVVATPNTTSQPVLSAWDRAVFSISTIGTYPVDHGPSHVESIEGGWGLDWASSDGSTLVVLATSNNSGPGSPGDPSVKVVTDQTSTSTDNGLTWKPLPISTTSFSTNLTTSAGAVAGTRVLTFGTTIPGWIGAGAVVNDTTHGTALNAYVQFVTATTITVDRDITSPGVSSGDTIKVGFAGSGQAQRYATNASTASGAVLHFASLPANYVHTGMLPYNLSNIDSIPNGDFITGGIQARVLSVSGNDVTLDHNIVSTVASGDVIEFQDAGHGGALAVSSPSNFCITTSDDSPFPYCTADSGATWNPVVIAGIPRAVSGSTVSSSTTVTVADSSNFLTGAHALLHDTAGCIGNSSSVVSITDATHIVITPAATCTAATDIIQPQVGYSFAYYLNIKNIAADRVTPNKFYMYNARTGKLYVSTASGANGTWAAVNTSPTDIFATYGIDDVQNAALKSVPGNAGHLFLTGANVGFSNTALIRTTDGGVNWTAVTGAQGAVTSVNAIGFGKAKPSGGGYPAVYISGQVGGVLSLWRSDDNCATWVNLGTNPAGSLDGTDDLDGDKNTYGTVYGAHNVNGWFYGTIH